METEQNLSQEGCTGCVAAREGAADGYGLLMNAVGSAAVRCLWDQDLTLLYANDLFYEAIGYIKGEYSTHFSTLRLYFQNHPEEFQKLQEALTSALGTGKPHVRVDCRMPVKKGGFIWMRFGITVTDEVIDGHPILLAVGTDISDVVHSRDQKKDYFEWMMDEYVGNIYISDIDTYELLYLNKVACETLQMNKSQLLGQKCYEVIQGRTSPCPFCTNDKLCEESFYEWEFFNPVLDRTFMIKNRLINWNGCKARIELSHDMYSTEYKLAKKDREREALLRTIPGGFARLDARDLTTVLWYGADFLNVIGYTKEQFEKELHSQFAYIHPDDIDRVRSVLLEVQDTGQSEVLEIRVISHSKETRILTTTLCYVSGENSWDGIPSFYTVGIDVTKERMEQARQRRALEEAYQAASVANSAKTNFLSTMSHDIRTPMNAIMGMSAIAQANLNSPDKVHDCLTKINVSSRHLLSLINEVLDMSKIESGKIDLSPEEINLAELIQNVSDMCRPLLTEKQLDLRINIGQVRHENIIADGDRLQQVFMNLLSNSIKYTPDGGNICLMISEQDSLSEKKAQYEFVFTDNGIGMSEDYIPHIFEPFSRAEDSRISKIQGTGLGMAITENIIRMMNGSIDVKSQPGVGSQFTVSVQFELVGEEEDCEKELEGLPVLVVDDDQIVCENATALLNELGMRGYWVLSGAEAVARAAEAHDNADDFFAVILDWKMPDMDGLETLKALRQRLGEDVPIIIISAYDYSNIEEEFLKAGADAFITKPLFKSKILHVLHLFCISRTGTSAPPPVERIPELKGKRILLVEDNELNREIALELLQMQGIAVECAENGQCAVDMFQASAPGYYNAVLMDIQMPVMNGYEATEAIRRLNRSDALSIPILALTANAFTADVSTAHSVGMNDHIAKPIDVDRLKEALLKWIG